MKKNKKMWLLGMTFVSATAIAVSTAVLTNKDVILGNAAGATSNCELVFNHKVDLVKETSGDYAQASTVRLFYKNASEPADRKNHIDLKAGGEIFTNASAYDAAKGWGSVVNGLENLSIEVGAGQTGKYEVYTSYTGVGANDWYKVSGKDPVTGLFNFSTFDNNGYPIMVTPRYFKIKAIDDIAFKKIGISCTTLANKPLKNQFADGTYIGTLSVNNPGLGIENTISNYKFTAKDGIITLNNILNPETETYDYTLNLYPTCNKSEGDLYYSTNPNAVETLYAYNFGNYKSINDIRYAGGTSFADITGVKKYTPCETLSVTASNGDALTDPVKLDVDAKLGLKAKVNYGCTDEIVWELKDTKTIRFADKSTSTKKVTGETVSIQGVKAGTATLKVTCGSKVVNVNIKVNEKVLELPVELANKTFTSEYAEIKFGTNNIEVIKDMYNDSNIGTYDLTEIVDASVDYGDGSVQYNFGDFVQVVLDSNNILTYLPTGEEMTEVASLSLPAELANKTFEGDFFCISGSFSTNSITFDDTMLKISGTYPLIKIHDEHPSIKTYDFSDGINTIQIDLNSDGTVTYLRPDFHETLTLN